MTQPTDTMTVHREHLADLLAKRPPNWRVDAQQLVVAIVALKAAQDNEGVPA